MTESPRDEASRASLLSRLAALPDVAVAALLALGVIGLLLALNPLADVPMNDDFSWSRSAEVFARTGKIAYNGWGNPILLPHTIAGALVIKLFGFSHIALGAFGIVSGAGFTAVAYLLARACGVARTLSLLVVALLTLNPVFLGVTPSFMSDIPTAFLCTASLLAFVRALTPSEGGRFGLRPLPLVIAVVFAYLAGANRQLFWASLGLAFFAPWFALPPADRVRRLLPQLALLFLAGALTSVWFSKQPYSVPLNLEAAQQYWAGARDLFFFLPYKFCNFIGLVALPLALPAAILSFRDKSARFRRADVLLTLCILVFAVPFLMFLVQPNSQRDLWNGRWEMTPYGQYATYQGVMVGGPAGYGIRPVVIPPAFGILLFLLGVVGDALTLFVLLRRRYTPVQLVLLISALVQIFLPFPWYAGGSIFDRYLPALLPGLLVVLVLEPAPLVVASRAADTAPPTTAPTAPALLPYLLALPFVLLFAFGGVAFATEYFEYTQTRALLYHGLRGKGVRPEHIDAGVENCGDTQIALEGYINSPNIRNPEGAFHPDRAGNCAFSPFLFPAMDAQYMLSTSSTPPDLSSDNHRDTLVCEPTPVGKQEYFSPLPPTTRAMYIYRVRKVNIGDMPVP